MRWTLIGCAAVVVFEAGWSLSAKVWAFDIGGFPQIAIGLLIETAIWMAAAFGAARDAGNVRAGVLSGVAVAFVTATLGWAVSSLIGSGAPDPTQQGLFLVVVTVVTITALGAAFGLAAGVIAHRTRIPTDP